MQHRDAGDTLGYRQLVDRGLFSVAGAYNTAFRFFQLELESWKLVPGGYGIGNIVLEAGVATFGTNRK